MSNVTDIRVGDRVRWSSAAGTLRGEITSIDLDLNANQELIPWITIKTFAHEYYGLEKHVRLCGTYGYLKMMKFQVIFRDVVNQKVAC
jgi:hypothetical protein